jgi:hypothetical protein
MKRVVVGLVAGVLGVLAGCASPVGSNTAQLTLKQAEAQKAKSLQLIVNAPSALADAGKIVSGDLAGVITAGGGNLVAASAGLITLGGGNVITAGGGNVITAGGGNVITAGGGNFRTLATSVETFTPVTQAALQLLDLNGKPLPAPYDKPVYTDAKGSLKFSLAKLNQPVLAVSIFKVGDKTYRESTIVAPDLLDKPLYLDPINTMLEARIRQLLAQSGKTPSFSNMDLKTAWDWCNKVNVQLKPELLTTTNDPQANAKVDDFAALYEDAIKQLEEAKMQEGADFIKGFLSKLKGN